MKKLSLISISLFLFYFLSIIHAQPNSFINKKTSISIDMLSYLQIEQITYYQTPLEIFNGELTAKDYIPDWYFAFCVNRNILKFKDNPEEIFKFIHESLLISHDEVLNVINNYHPKANRLPYIYCFGEMRLKHLPTGQQIIVVYSKENETKLPEITMKMPGQKNTPTEKLDSIRMQAVGVNYYIEDNGVVKFPESTYVDSLLTNNGQYFIKPNIDDFKNLLFRSNIYKASIREKGKRKFSTMEKGVNGHKVKSVSDKP